MRYEPVRVLAARWLGHAVTQKWVLPKERPESAPVDSKVVLPKAP